MERWFNPSPPVEEPESESISPKKDLLDPDTCWDMPALVDPEEKPLPNPLEEWPLIEKPPKS